jgi:hypothetical protein
MGSNLYPALVRLLEEAANGVLRDAGLQKAF